MADLIDFIASALEDQKEKAQGKGFVEQLKAGDAKKLQGWFEEQGFTGVSLEQCEKLISNKDKVIHNSEASLKSNY